MRFPSKNKEFFSGIFVKAIDPTGVAGRDGSLRVEDRLMEANGRSLTGLTHKQSASVIRVSCVPLGTTLHALLEFHECFL